MKKVVICLIAVLLSVFALPTTAFAVSGTTVDRIDYSADLRSDGSVFVTEVWTVTFSEESDGFTRVIEMPEGEFESFKNLSDFALSADGVVFTEGNGDSAINGTYSVAFSEGKCTVKWKTKSKNVTRVFTLRYVKTGAVKLYGDRAYFYTTIISEDDTYGVCHDVNVSITTAKKCFSEDFVVEESGSLAGKKSDGEITFNADNFAGVMKTGISLPSSVFDAGYLTVIVEDTSFKETIRAVSCVLAAIAVILFILYLVNRQNLFRRKWEKKCLKKVHRESSYEAQSAVFGIFSPARVINIVYGVTLSGADRFIVTVLDLVKRGYIVPSADGFTASLKSDSDTVGRPLDRNEKTVIDIFSSEKWQTVLSRPKRFYAVTEKFNRNSAFLPLFFTLTPAGRQLVSRCFELRLAAVHHEYVLPEEISDDFFKNGKFTTADLLISLFNEFEMSASAEYRKTDASKYKYNLFMLRDVYSEGEKIVREEEIRRQMQKKNKISSDGE